MTTPISETSAPVAVLGLGPMGSALARAFVGAGVPTTVWNRTASRTEPLVAAGATGATTAAGAVSAAPLVVVCLRNHDAVRAVLGGLDAATLHGRTVVNLTSTTPDEARASARWARERGISYLSGAIMVPTPMIGDPAALVLYSGDTVDFERHAPVLRHLAGRADHLGEDHGLAPLYDVAMLEIFFAGMTSFLHAAAMTSAQGVDAQTFLPYAQQIVSILPDTVNALAADVDRGEYPGDQDSIAMELAALEHLAHTSAATGLDSRLPELMRDLAHETVAAGDGHLGWSRIVEALRKR